MSPIDWKWTEHINFQIIERTISRGLVEATINNPDEIVSGKYGRKIYQKIVDDKLLRVVTEDNKLITVYLTEKIGKYMEGKRK